MSQDTGDIVMTDVQDGDSEAATAVPPSRPPKRHPLPPTPSEHAEPRGTERSKSPKSKTVEKQIGELKNQLSEARHINLGLQVAYTESQIESNELKTKNETLQNTHDVTCKKMAAELLNVEGGKKNADANTHLALLRVQEISEELQKCKDELFDLQPPNQVADTHISAEWEALCSSITTWIDDESGGVEDLRSQLIELQAEKGLSEAVSKYWGKDRQLIANHYFQSSSILDGLLRYNIHCFLEERVFDDRVYMLGLAPHEAKLLLTIERQMAQLEPRRDPSIIGLWRSEALVALSSSAGFGSLLEEDTREISQEAREIFEPLLQRRTSGAMAAFDRDIIIPAIHFASTLRQSTANYHFVFRVASNKDEERRPALRPPGNRLLLYKSDLENIDVLDFGSRITLKKGRKYEEASDGSIAYSILVTHPALYRATPTGRILLSRQLVLADLVKPPQRRGPPKDVASSRGLLDNLSFKFNS